MAARWGLEIDCAHPGKLADFWAEALGYQHSPPPRGFATWPRVQAAVERLTAIGATVVQVYDHDGRPDHVWMEDPEGNEFCVV
jgi:hypothetical protein